MNPIWSRSCGYGQLDQEYDDTRLVQYENNDPGLIASDIKCTMYPTMELLEYMIADNNDRRPIVLIEYAYQITNSSGNFEQFNRLAEKYEIFQGGFVWDWQDKCLPAVNEKVRPSLVLAEIGRGFNRLGLPLLYVCKWDRYGRSYAKAQRS